MKEFFSSVKFKIILVILTVLAGFMLYAASAEGVDTIPSKVIGFLVTPFQQIAAGVSDSVSGLFGKFANAGQISGENQELQKQLEQMQQQLIEYDKVKKENQQMKDYLGLKDQNPELVFEAAQVVERYPSSRFYSFKINKGSLHGVEYRDTVITSAGVVGVVTSVGYTYSQVDTILNPSVNIGCIGSRTGDTGMLEGSLQLSQDGLCRLSYIDKGSGIAAGDTIITAGSNRYPKELVVGTVKEVLLDENGSALRAVVMPAVDIKAVKDVFVVKSFFGQAPDENAAEGE